METRFAKLAFLISSILALALTSSAQTRTAAAVSSDSDTGCIIDTRPNRPRPATVSGGILNKKALILPQPKFFVPKGKHGRVSVQVTVSHDGSVSEAAGASGPEALKPIAEKAALQAKFSPTFLSGYPVKVTGLIWYRY